MLKAQSELFTHHRRKCACACTHRHTCYLQFYAHKIDTGNNAHAHARTNTRDQVRVLHPRDSVLRAMELMVACDVRNLPVVSGLITHTHTL